MDEARRIADAGFSGAGIVRADTQTAGRGRIEGRRWTDLPGRSLLMTIILPEGAAAIQALPLRVGLGVARALERAIAPAAFQDNIELIPESPPRGAPLLLLKWPNDILALRADGYGKLCGILCESARGRALAGIGINLQRSALTAAPTSFSPLSLEEVLGSIPPSFENLDNAARLIATSVLEALAAPQWKSDYERLLWRRGEKLIFFSGHPDRHERIEGICEGVGDDGSLILNIGGQRRAFVSGEISSHYSV